MQVHTVPKSCNICVKFLSEVVLFVNLPPRLNPRGQNLLYCRLLDETDAGVVPCVSNLQSTQQFR